MRTGFGRRVSADTRAEGDGFEDNGIAPTQRASQVCPDYTTVIAVTDQRQIQGLFD